MKPVIPVLLVLVAIAAAVSAAWLFLSRSFPSGRGEVVAEQRALPAFSRIAQSRGVSGSTSISTTLPLIAIQ